MRIKAAAAKAAKAGGERKRTRGSNWVGIERGVASINRGGKRQGGLEEEPPYYQPPGSRSK